MDNTPTTGEEPVTVSDDTAAMDTAVADTNAPTTGGPYSGDFSVFPPIEVSQQSIDLTEVRIDDRTPHISMTAPSLGLLSTNSMWGELIDSDFAVTASETYSGANGKPCLEVYTVTGRFTSSDDFEGRLEYRSSGEGCSAQSKTSWGITGTRF